MDEIAGGSTRERRPRWMTWVVGAAVLAAIGVGLWQAVARSGKPPRVTFTSSAPSSPPPAVPVLGQTSLTCQDGTTSVSRPGARLHRVAGLTSDGWRGTLHPDVAQHGIYFQKAFLYVTPRASPWTRVSVTRPSTARLYYVNGVTWTDQQPLRPLAVFDPDAGVTSVSFQYCGDHPQGYFGGLITKGPACVVLRIRSQVAGAVATLLRIPVGKRCE